MPSVKTNFELADSVRKDPFYLRYGSPTSLRVLEALRKVDRKQFTPASVSAFAYNNSPIPIGFEQTCSQPTIVAVMAELLQLQEGMRVLEIGTGCGYSAAITAHLIGEKGHLTTIEYRPELAILAKMNLKEHFGEKKAQKRIQVVVGDGSLGFAQNAPYDRIYLTAGVLDTFDPHILAEQLKPTGILIYPEQYGDLIIEMYKGKKKIQEQHIEGVSFVPLEGKNV